MIWKTRCIFAYINFFCKSILTKWIRLGWTPTTVNCTQGGRPTWALCPVAVVTLNQQSTFSGQAESERCNFQIKYSTNSTKWNFPCSIMCKNGSLTCL